LECAQIVGDVRILCGQRTDIANLDVGRLYAWLFGARTEKPAPSPDHTRAVKSVAGDQKLHEVSAAQVWTYYSARSVVPSTRSINTSIGSPR
jgi:hypothetical protein